MMSTLIRVISYICVAGISYWVGLAAIALVIANAGAGIDVAITQAPRLLPPVIGLGGICIAAVFAAVGGIDRLKSLLRRPS